jgi:ornithine cyclodeaminase/alanine dehydrogenase-like protein (mu-crystallin family)
MHATPLRYLSGADVLAALPDVEERLRLAEHTMLGLGAGAQLPPKIGVQPGPAESFAHAMPALLPGAAADGADDLLGMKWVVGFPGNVAARLPAIHGLTILSDGRTGQPRAVVDAGALTAHRTAAVSGLAIERWGPRRGSAPRVALIGAGAQARSHLPVVSHLLPDARLILCDQDAERVETLAQELAAAEPSIGRFASVETTTDMRRAAHGADLVLTMISFGRRHQAVPAETLGDAGLIVAVDYDMCVPAAVARAAALFIVDDREQYLANRTETVFTGYPDDPLTIGEAIRGAVTRPGGAVLVSHLGVGLADVVFADAVLRVAESRGIGTILPR